MFSICKSFIVSVTNPIINPIQSFLRISKHLVDVFILSQFVRNISLLEVMIVSDGIFNAVKFTKEYVYYKIKNNLISGDGLSKGDKSMILNEYNNLYILNVFDRYILYVSLYIYYKITCLVFLLPGEVLPISVTFMNYILILSMTFPYIQNYILELESLRGYIANYQSNKKVFVLYSFSKTIINTIKDLDPKLDSIKNYQIFVLYKYLSFHLVVEFIKSYLFINLLYFLRDNQQTYYYYKAIKLSYYYSTGYLFNIITLEDSIYIINIIITEKRWYDLAKLEIVHAFYTIITSKYNKKSNVYLDTSIYLAKFCTLWSFICLLKVLTVKMNTLLLLFYFIIDYRLHNKRDFKEQFIKRSGIIFIVYCLLLLNTNDLIISAIFVLYKFIYLVCCELLFFINNANDIKKVLEFYNNKGKVLKIKTQKIEGLQSTENEYVVISS